MNLYPVTAYVRHLLSSRSSAGHGVHSPFIYDFLTRVVRNKSDGNVVFHLERLRREMLRDKRSIVVDDLGAGSLTKTGRERKVADIAGRSSLPKRDAELLSRIAWSMEGSFSASRRIKKMRHVSRGDRHREQCKGIILELGTSLGLSTLALALGASDRQVVTVEGSGALADMAGENLKRHDVENVSVMNCEFSEALERIRAEGKQVVLAFIDGNHRGTALIKYIGEIAEMGEDMIIVADDIHLTKDMYHAWKTVVRSSIATATMETFRFGILFRIRGLTPGDYRIRC